MNDNHNPKKGSLPLIALAVLLALFALWAWYQASQPNVPFEP
jgi:hypothetical protein